MFGEEDLAEADGKASPIDRTNLSRLASAKTNARISSAGLFSYIRLEGQRSQFQGGTAHDSSDSGNHRASSLPVKEYP